MIICEFIIEMIFPQLQFKIKCYELFLSLLTEFELVSALANFHLAAFSGVGGSILKQKIYSVRKIQYFS